MTANLNETPLTETYFETTLWRLLVRLAPTIDMARHPPDPCHFMLLDAVEAGPLTLPTLEKTWAGFTVVGKVMEKRPADDLTEGEQLWVAITKLRQLLLTNSVDAEANTPMGQAMFLVLTVGLLAGRVFGDDAAEIMHLREVADAALKAKAGRAAHAKALNEAKTAWHPAAIEKARRHRETFPRRAATRIADLIHSDPTIPTPSYDQVLTTVRAWEKNGTIPSRAKA